jgi:hypothetical protein
MHLSQSRVERFSPRDRAWNGQAVTHLPQATHTPAFASATKPDDAISGEWNLTMVSMPPQQHLQQLQMA